MSAAPFARSRNTRSARSSRGRKSRGRKFTSAMSASSSASTSSPRSGTKKDDGRRRTRDRWVRPSVRCVRRRPRCGCCSRFPSAAFSASPAWRRYGRPRSHRRRVDNDEICRLLKEIRDTQREHLAEYRRVTERSLELQERAVARQAQMAYVYRRVLIVGGGLVAALLVLLVYLLARWSPHLFRT